MAVDEKLKKGDAAPLEGVVGPEIMGVLNLAFLSMNIGMCQKLALTVAAAMPTNTGPAMSGLGGFSSKAPAITQMTASLPRPPTFRS